MQRVPAECLLVQVAQTQGRCCRSSETEVAGREHCPSIPPGWNQYRKSHPFVSAGTLWLGPPCPVASTTQCSTAHTVDNSHLCCRKERNHLSQEVHHEHSKSWEHMPANNYSSARLAGRICRREREDLLVRTVHLASQYPDTSLDRTCTWESQQTAGLAWMARMTLLVGVKEHLTVFSLDLKMVSMIHQVMEPMWEQEKVPHSPQQLKTSWGPTSH
mmetsp:Transcript_15309/g.35188  ORF Transcript_15309/g.35188 Transcript_15309/m.35188 type:complete len:216 (-) Transcript_15309:258-905(-)